jgi:hypothetical protein
MRLHTFDQLIRAIEGLADPDQILVFGSSALLADHPDLGEQGRPLETSYDADILHPSFPENMPDGWESRLIPVPGFT